MNFTEFDLKFPNALPKRFAKGTFPSQSFDIWMKKISARRLPRIGSASTRLPTLHCGRLILYIRFRMNSAVKLRSFFSRIEWNSFSGSSVPQGTAMFENHFFHCGSFLDFQSFAAVISAIATADPSTNHVGPINARRRS